MRTDQPGRHRARAQQPSNLFHLWQQEAGFTLIEMILTLVLLGIMAAISMLGISNIVTGFMTSKQLTASAAKGQLALLRVSREFRVITSVTSASATSITFVALHPDDDPDLPPVPTTYTVARSGSTITLSHGADTDILVDQVNAFSLAYYDTYDGTAQTTWTAARRLIQLTITLNGPDNSTLSFSTRVTPRNI